MEKDHLLTEAMPTKAADERERAHDHLARVEAARPHLQRQLRPGKPDTPQLHGPGRPRYDFPDTLTLAALMGGRQILRMFKNPRKCRSGQMCLQAHPDREAKRRSLMAAHKPLLDKSFACSCSGHAYAL